MTSGRKRWTASLRGHAEFPQSLTGATIPRLQGIYRAVDLDGPVPPTRRRRIPRASRLPPALEVDLPKVLTDMPNDMLDSMYVVNDAFYWSMLCGEEALTKKEEQKAERHACKDIDEKINDNDRLRILNRIGRGRVRFEFK